MKLGLNVVLLGIICSVCNTFMMDCVCGFIDLHVDLWCRWIGLNKDNLLGYFSCSLTHGCVGVCY